MAIAPDRRTFLSLLGLGVLGARTDELQSQGALRFGYFLSAERAASQPVLQALAAIGYRDLDLDTPQHTGQTLLDLRKAMDQRGITAPSRHVPMPQVFSNARTVLNDSKILGSPFLVCEIPAPQRTTMAGYRRVAELLTPAGKITQYGGVQLVVRLHADDLTAKAGTVPLDFLLANTDRVFVKFQAALAAFEGAGRNVLDYFARHRDRFVSVHVADTGAPELPRVLDAARDAGVRHVFVADPSPDASFERAKQHFDRLATP